MFSEFARWWTGGGKHVEKSTSNMFVLKKENTTHAEQHQEWGGERNDNMLAAGFVETTCLILNNI